MKIIKAFLGCSLTSAFLLVNSSPALSSSCNKQDDDGNTKIHRKLSNMVILTNAKREKGYAEKSILRKILQCGSDLDVNLKNKFQESFLELSIRANSRAITDQLLLMGVDLFVRDIQGRTLLSQLVSTGAYSVDIVLKNLLVNDSSFERALLAVFDENGAKRNKRLVNKILGVGVNLGYLDSKGRTLLMRILGSSVDFDESLVIQNFVDSDIPLDLLNVVDECGTSALMLAAADGSSRVVEFLIQSGANIDLLDKAGRSALHYATTYILFYTDKTITTTDGTSNTSGSASTRSFGAQSFFGALLGPVGIGGGYSEGIANTSMFSSSTFDSESITESKRILTGNPGRYVNSIGYLVRAGANVDSQDINGMTPLMFATVQGQSLMVQPFLANGADPLLKSELNMSALDYAKQFEYQLVVDLFVK